MYRLRFSQEVTLALGFSYLLLILAGVAVLLFGAAA